MIYFQIPGWAFLACGVGLYLYQLCDSLDGKQAVRVQDSPIEEISDHGCDALSTLFVIICASVATKLYQFPLLHFVFIFLCMTAFFMTHLSCHVTHVMVFGKYVEKKVKIAVESRLLFSCAPTIAS